MSQAVTKRAPDPEERRKQILAAAVEVFADKGFHKTRVSDLARAAGVAHGLIYHYFESKDDLLTSIFDGNWSLFTKVLEDLVDQPELSAGDKLSRVVDLLLEALEVAPKTIQVVIQEVSRSDRFAAPHNVQAFRRTFSAVERILERGQRDGEVRPDGDPRLMSHVFMGAMEMVCTGWLLGHMADQRPTDMKQTLVQTLLGGIVKGS